MGDKTGLQVRNVVGFEPSNSLCEGANNSIRCSDTLTSLGN